MQLSFDPDLDPDRLVVTLASNALSGTSAIEVNAFTRKGVKLASAGLVMRRMEESELLPTLLYRIGMGWLYAGSREMTVIPADWFREQRKAMAKRASQ